MLQATVIGNLAADATVQDVQGRNFVSFAVIHNESYVDSEGAKHERVQRVSCALNGNGGNLLPYLRKGVRVFVQGRMSVRTYSSPTARAIVAGIDLSVTHVELCGSQPDQVPRQLITEDGVIVPVNKHFAVDKNALKECAGKTLHDNAGSQFAVDNKGWITPII